MRPSTLHLTDEHHFGGLETMLESMKRSDIISHCDIIHSVVDTNKIHAPRFPVEQIYIHFSMSWKKIPYIRSLKKNNPQAKIIIVEHHYSANFVHYCVPSRRRFFCLLRLVYSFVDRVVCVSNAQKDWLYAHKLCSFSKIMVIQASCSLEKYLKIPSMEIREGEKIRIGLIGRYVFQKGFDKILPILGRLDHNKFEVSICGAGVLERDLLRQIKNKPHMRMMNFTSETESFYRQCHVILIPSRYEPFGLVALEAKASGRVVISSNVDGLLDQKVHDSLVYEEEKPEQVLEIINSLNANEIMYIGKHSRNKTIDHWKEFVNHWKQFILEVSKKEVVA